MPIYEYRCPNCDNKFDLLRSFSQAHEAATCLKCHHEAERLISSFASFAKDSRGIATPIGGGSSCSTCSASSCATCGQG